ncbi:MAG TPA: tetratricopeptide repeat protein [Myxococcales bacterium]
MRPSLLPTCLVLLACPAFAGNAGSREYSRAMEAHHDDDFKSAIEHWQRALDAGYRPGATSYNIACAYSQLGDAASAFEWLDKASEAGFDVAGYIDHDDDFDNIRDLPRFREFLRKSREARVQRRSGRASGVAARFHELESRKSSRPGSWDRSGHELLEVGKYDLAAKAFTREAELADSKGSAWYNAACAYSLAGNKGPALDALQRAIEEGYDGPEHMERDGDLDNIRSEPRYKDLRALAEDLAMPGGWGGRSTGVNRAMWRAAAEHFSRLAQKYPRMGRIYFSLGFAQLYAGDEEAAARSFEKTAQMGYRPGASLYNLACAQARMGQKDKAIETLKKALDAGFSNYGLLRGDGDLDNLHGDPRFRELVRGVRGRDDGHFKHGFHFRSHDEDDEDEDDDD